MKLHQNRIVIIGRNPRDAHAYANTDRFRDEIESPVLVSAASHPLTIRGGLAGMHIGTAYVTEIAPEGENYGVVQEALEAARRVNPDLRVIEEPRLVRA